MGRTLSNRPLRLLVAGMLLMLAFGIGSAVGAQSSTGKTFYACEAPNGLVVLTSTVQRPCPKGTKLITWNQTGPKGDMGSPGIVNVYIKQGVSYTVEPLNTRAVASVDCDAGEWLIGGGYIASSFLNVMGSYPDESSNSWVVGAANPSSALVGGMSAYAVCAIPSK
jgi:hypothetical protein